MSKKKVIDNNEAKKEEKGFTFNTDDLSMFELMKMIEHNTKKIEQLSMKIDRIQNINNELKEHLKSKVENI